MAITAERRRAYTRARLDLVELLPPLGPGVQVVLDVGCSNGATGRALMRERDVDVIGIEIDPDLASEATSHLARVEVGDAMDSIVRLVDDGVCVSAVLFGDVLEHLLDPWACVDAAQALMPAGGYLVGSVPNVAHVDTLIHLLRGTWPMRERGIHDRSHLRFFAHRDLVGLFGRGRASITCINRVYRLVERPHRANALAPAFGRVWKNGFTFQYHVLAEVAPAL